MLRRTIIIAALLLAGQVPASSSASAQNNPTPYSLPFKLPPGPDTWLIGQEFGNTGSAYNFGRYWYGAGEGLHFGLDFATPCKTPVVAIADGIVDNVDNFEYGLTPHNVAIFHPSTGYVSLYGHLYARSALLKGQTVKRGELVGYSGDPDLTCVSRPHLHLEIRSHNYLVAYPPARFIDADWPLLSSIGYYSFGGFVKDLYDPRAWQTISDQPSVKFAGKTLNSFRTAWPPLARVSPSPLTLPEFRASAIAKATLTRLTEPGCCSLPWWSADSGSVRYLDSPSGQLAKVISVGLDGRLPEKIADAPPGLPSADGKYEVLWQNNSAAVTRLADDVTWTMTTGAWPTISPGSMWLLWQYSSADNVPNYAPPSSEVWIARLDGTEPTLLLQKQAGSVYWLDDNRILLVTRENKTNIYDLDIFTISTKTTEPLLKVENLRNLSVAPGGHSLMYYAPFQDIPSTSGIYRVDTTSGAKPTRVPFFGTWRWRDSTSVIYIPFTPGLSMSLVLYDFARQQSRPLTDPSVQPFEIANDDWEVAPDGHAVVFWSAKDYALWLTTLVP